MAVGVLGGVAVGEVGLQVVHRGVVDVVGSYEGVLAEFAEGEVDGVLEGDEEGFGKGIDDVAAECDFAFCCFGAFLYEAVDFEAVGADAVAALVVDAGKDGLTGDVGDGDAGLLELVEEDGPGGFDLAAEVDGGVDYWVVAGTGVGGGVDVEGDVLTGHLP